MKKLLVALFIACLAWYAFYGQEIIGITSNGAQEYLKRIKKVNSTEVREMLENSRDQVRFIHIYKSTCVLCRIYFPSVADIVEKFKEMPVIVLSTDRFPLFLASFLAGQDLPFTPYLFDGSPEELSATLRYVGLHYDDNEPYTAVISGTGVVQEFEVGAGFAGRIETHIANISGQR